MVFYAEDSSVGRRTGEFKKLGREEFGECGPESPYGPWVKEIRCLGREGDEIVEGDADGIAMRSDWGNFCVPYNGADLPSRMGSKVCNRHQGRRAG